MAQVYDEVLGSKVRFGLTQFLPSLHDLLQFTQMSKAARDKSKGNVPTASED